MQAGVTHTVFMGRCCLRLVDRVRLEASRLFEDVLGEYHELDDIKRRFEANPVYNRLFWNYTRGIDSGEVIYALNYNITESQEDAFDGIIGECSQQTFYEGQCLGACLPNWCASITAPSHQFNAFNDLLFAFGTKSL